MSPQDPQQTDRASERYASMFTHHPHAAYSVDRRGYYTDANDHALEMTGLSLEEMRRTHFSEVIHPDDVHLLQAGFEGALTGEPQVIDARVVRVDGEVLDIRCTAIPDVVGGEIVGVHGITEDVTEARRLVRELEESNAAKLLFLATVSHEVRTPLAALVGAAELLMDAELDAEPGHYAEIVHRSGVRLMHVAEDILEFSGLEAHQTMLRRRPFEVRAVVDDVASWAVPHAEERGLTLSCHVDDSVPATGVGDSRRVSQVLGNLVQNAITFTEAGSVAIRGALTSHHRRRGERHLGRDRGGRHRDRDRAAAPRRPLRAVHPGQPLPGACPSGHRARTGDLSGAGRPDGRSAARAVGAG